MRGMWGWGLGLALWAGCGGWGAAPGPDAEQGDSQGSRRDIGVAELFEVKGSVNLIDVRTPVEYNAVHIPGAVNLPPGDLDPAHPVLEALDPDEPIYLVCASGKRSSRAANRLAAHGFQVINVEGGTRAWRQAGYPTE